MVCLARDEPRPAVLCAIPCFFPHTPLPPLPPTHTVLPVLPIRSLAVTGPSIRRNIPGLIAAAWAAGISLPDSPARVQDMAEARGTHCRTFNYIYIKTNILTSMEAGPAPATQCTYIL